MSITCAEDWRRLRAIARLTLDRLASHHEHTLVITRGAPVILTAEAA
jgi:hypothetical protein